MDFLIFGNSWTKIRLHQVSNNIENRNRRNYLVDNSQKIIKNFNSLMKAYKKIEKFWANIRWIYKCLNPSINTKKILENKDLDLNSWKFLSKIL